MDSAWDSEQLANAHMIISEGERLGASPREIQIAVMTAMQESSLRNVPYGDRDSLGLFQQRDAWGTTQERLDPTASTRMFFTGGHDGQPGLFDYRSSLPDMTLGEAAQKVQVSAYPSAYDKWEGDAGTILAEFEQLPTTQPPPPTPDPFAPEPGSPVADPTDSDHDGITNEFEALLGTDPHTADTDHDHLSDAVETLQTHTNPLIANDPHLVAHLLAHPDTATAHPARIPLAALQAGFGAGATLDHDHDGLSDLTETKAGSDPYNADTDHDQLGDGVEYRLGASLTSIDTDHDGITDNLEYDAGTLAPTPTPIPDPEPDPAAGLDTHT